MSHRAIVVGTGFGARVHVPALQAVGFEVAALVGRDLPRTRRRAERLGIEHAATSLEEALELPDVDTVTLATPPDRHAEQALAAIAAGRHLLCEKPFTLDASEARRVCAAARSADVVHRLGFEFRFAPERALAARAIAGGAIGEPRWASFVSHVPLLLESEMPDWWWRPERGGGWLLASGSHLVDQVRVWLGEIESVRADVLALSRGAGAADDSFSVLARTRSGVSVTLQQTGASHGAMGGLTRVVGSAGSLWIERGEVRVADAQGTRTLPVPDDLALRAAPGPSDRGRFTHMELGPYTRLCASLRDEIDGKLDLTANPRPPTLVDGLASMQVLDAIRQAAASGARVQVESSP